MKNQIEHSVLVVILLVSVCITGCYRAPARPTSATNTTERETENANLDDNSSPFLNTQADASYVGSQACVRCHEDEHSTFAFSGMGRSMAEVDPEREPPDGAFDHAPSSRHYEIVRRDGRLWHREFLRRAGMDNLLLVEHPLKYVVGSGRHSRTYVIELERTKESPGFLLESPVTWYEHRKAWGMSPGYDRPAHLGFERAVGEGCLD